MTIKNLSLTIAFTALSLFVTHHSSAQTGTPAVWKKTVTRMIDINQPVDEKKHHLHDAGTNNTLLEAIVSELKSGRLSAYSNYDNTFSTKLSKSALSDIISGRQDTITVIDPITGIEKTVVKITDFNPDAIKKYRILEEWTFTPQTGKTEIQITGIAPIKEVYGDDGIFRGVQAMFWLKYNEARPYINKYEQYHPEHTIARLIWDDYFLSDVKPKETK